jgi:hypothetical protein
MALATDDGLKLVEALLEELRMRRIVCPSLAVIERQASSSRNAVVRNDVDHQHWRVHRAIPPAGARLVTPGRL